MTDPRYCKECGADLEVIFHYDDCSQVRHEWEKIWREADRRFEAEMKRYRGEGQDETER